MNAENHKVSKIFYCLQWPFMLLFSAPTQKCLSSELDSLRIFPYTSSGYGEYNEALDILVSCIYRACLKRQIEHRPVQQTNDHFAPLELPCFLVSVDLCKHSLSGPVRILWQRRGCTFLGHFQPFPSWPKIFSGV